MEKRPRTQKWPHIKGLKEGKDPFTAARKRKPTKKGSHGGGEKAKPSGKFAVIKGVSASAADAIITSMKSDDTRYMYVNRKDTTVRAHGGTTIAGALNSSTKYLQWGFLDSDPENPVIKAVRDRKVIATMAKCDRQRLGRRLGRNPKLYLNPKHGGDEAVFRAAFPRVFLEIDKYLQTNNLSGFELTQYPVWANGKFYGRTLTHFDDYLNFVLVLQGRKTFYLAAADDIKVPVGVGRKGRPNEAWSATPMDWGENAEAHKPDDYEDAAKYRRVYKDNRADMYRIDVTPGTLLVIPSKWWHYVASDPQTVMINFWYRKINRS